MTIDGDDAVGGVLSTTVEDETVADVTVSTADAGSAWKRITADTANASALLSTPAPFSSHTSG